MGQLALVGTNDFTFGCCRKYVAYFVKITLIKFARSRLAKSGSMPYLLLTLRLTCFSAASLFNLHRVWYMHMCNTASQQVRRYRRCLTSSHNQSQSIIRVIHTRCLLPLGVMSVLNLFPPMRCTVIWLVSIVRTMSKD